MPQEINQEQLTEQLGRALIDDQGKADFKVFGSRGGHFEKIPEGYDFKQAQESFDKHIIEMLFGEKIADMAKTVQGRMALLAVVQNANAQDEEGSGAILTEVGDDTPMTKQ
tara:strand:+ start:346 stop:678 length:333 start_codon:yes stop_codon:yes gene_type:complete